MIPKDKTCNEIDALLYDILREKKNKVIFSGIILYAITANQANVLTKNNTNQLKQFSRRNRLNIYCTNLFLEMGNETFHKSKKQMMAFMQQFFERQKVYCLDRLITFLEARKSSFISEPKETKKTEHFQYYTNNTATDFLRSNVPYDLKQTTDISYLVNNVYILPLALFNARMLVNLRRALVQLIDAQDSVKHSYEKTHIIHYTRDILKQVEKISLDKSNKNIWLEITNLNRYMVKNPPFEGFRMAKLILTPENPDLLNNIDKSALDQIPLIEGKLDAVKAKKAIMGIISKYPPETINNVTNGLYTALSLAQSKLEPLI